MKKVAKFSKVSYEEFSKAIKDTFQNQHNDETIKDIYNYIKLPCRATNGSAGYDFFAPFGFGLNDGQTLKIPTGIRCEIDSGWVLKCYPRSGLGFKYGMKLLNTVGIIDSDYFYSDNEGHIFAKIKNDNSERKWLFLDSGDAFMQGIFVEYGVTYDDDEIEKSVRNGGFGSTSK